MAQPKQSSGLELPLGSPAYVRALLRGSEVSCSHADQPPHELPAHSHTQGQASFLIEPAGCVIQWPDKKGRWQEKIINGPHIYVAIPGQPHASRWERKAGLLDVYYEPETFHRLFPRKALGVYFADAGSVAGSDFLIWQLTTALRHLCELEPLIDAFLREVLSQLEVRLGFTPVAWPEENKAVMPSLLGAGLLVVSGKTKGAVYSVTAHSGHN